MINSLTQAHMVAQIRSKQLAIHHTQEKLRANIVTKFNAIEELSGFELVKQIKTNIHEFSEASSQISQLCEDTELTQLGYPIKFSKTHLQLDMLSKFVKDQDESLISLVEQGKLYNGLSNQVTKELPTLGAPNTEQFWGNENSSVSSVLLFSIGYSLSLPEHQLCGNFYPFYNPEYKGFVSQENYPFASEKGMWLFGDYQFGGHNYFTEHKLFTGEDCSSSIGRATGLTHLIKEFSTNLIKDFSTSSIRAKYNLPNNDYGYSSVTSEIDAGGIDLDKIKPGDIWLKGGHTAAILTRSDNRLKCLEFSRNLEAENNKILGGGIFERQLSFGTEAPIYILRKNEQTLKESCDLPYLIEQIDEKYITRFAEDPTMDCTGDCSEFLPNFVE